jgi:hypothetical protein
VPILGRLCVTGERAMAEIAINQAAFAGFGILRRKPWAPLVWSLLYAGVLGGLVIFLGGAFIQAIGKLVTLRSNGAAPPTELILGLLGGIFSGYFLALIVFWVLGAVINMAVVRAVMEPEASAFAYLRLGAVELWLMLANFLLFILYSIASTILAIPVAIVSIAAISMAKDAAPFVTLPFQALTWAVTIWLGLRFCMVAPMIFADRKFRLFESWSFTRGRTVRLFLVGLVIALVTAAIYLVLGGVGFAIGIPMFTQVANSITPRAFFTETPDQIWRQVEPFLVLYILLVWIGSAVVFPLLFAPWPDVYRQLKGGELAATFS